MFGVKMAKTQNESSSLETLAKLTIPIVLGVAVLCMLVLGIAYVTRPEPAEIVASPNRSQRNEEPAQRNEERGEEVAENSEQENKDENVNPPPANINKPPNQTASNSNKAPNSNQANNFFAPPQNQTQVNRPPANTLPTSETPKVQNGGVPVKQNAKYELTIANGNIRLGGEDFDIGSALPSYEKYDSGFEYLHFNGVDQHLLVPPVPQEVGTLIVTAKTDARQSVVVIDSSQERLTIRKNRGGIRWRIAGSANKGPIRDVDVPFDETRWHHYVLTWQADAKAIFYMDGVQIDEFDYKHENKKFRFFNDVNVSRNAMRDKKFFPSDVQEVRVFNTVIPKNEVEAMFAEKKAKFSDVFGN